MHAYHGANIGNLVGSALSVLHSQCEDDLRTLHVVHAVKVTVVVVHGVVAIFSGDNLLGQCFTLVILVLTDKQLGIEQQTGLQHTVHALVGTIYHRVVGIINSQ